MLVPRSLLDLWYPERNLLAVWTSHKGALLLGLSEPRKNVTKRDSIGPHSERRAPFFSDRLGQARNPRLRNRIIRLSRVAVNARGTRDIDNGSGLAVFDPEVRRRRTDELEGSFGMEVHNGVPLLVAHLVDDTVVCVAGIVDNDVNLAPTKLGRLLDQRLDVLCIEHIARHRDRPPARRVDTVGYGLRFGGVNVRDNDQRALVGKEPGCFGTDALAAARDDGDLADEHTLRVIEVGGNLGDPGSHDDSLCTFFFEELKFGLRCLFFLLPISVWHRRAT